MGDWSGLAQMFAYQFEKQIQPQVLARRVFNLHKSNYAESSLRAGPRLSHAREWWKAKRSGACASMLLYMTLYWKHYPFLWVEITEELTYHGSLY